MKYTHFYLVPFTGLGLHNGFRGNQWLENRLKVFKEFVLPSLLNQGDGFYVWFCWRSEEKENYIVKEFQEFLSYKAGIKTVHTFGGIPFYDDKYDDKTARERLMKTLEISLPSLESLIDTSHVLLTIQPSDDLYFSDTPKRLRDKFDEVDKDKAAVGWKFGYIMNYTDKELAEYSTTSWTTDSVSTYHTDTTPPFFTIIFPKHIFLDPQKHFDHIGPYKSHENIVDVMPYYALEGRGFIVGTHGENISTTYNHRYKGRIIEGKERDDLLMKAGIFYSKPIKVNYSNRVKLRRLVNRLPFRNVLKSIYYLLPIKFRIF